VGVAQLVERRSVAPNVAGSIPVSHPNPLWQIVPLLPTEQAIHLVFEKGAVRRKQHHVFHSGLGDEHAVKRIAVMRR
jgi:hypothetical protein